MKQTDEKKCDLKLKLIISALLTFVTYSNYRLLLTWQNKTN